MGPEAEFMGWLSSTWLKAAIGMLQARGWAEAFDIDEFMDKAYARFKGWYEGNSWQYADNKASYVQRKFP